MPAKTVEVDGEEWGLDGDPSMGTVKYVRSLEMEMFRDKLTDEQVTDLAEGSGGEIDESDMMKQFLEDEGMDGMMEMMWDNDILPVLQTICLASDKKLTTDQVDNMSSRTFQELKEAAEEALGGDADDFFNQLGLASSFQQNETLQETVQEMNQSGNDSPPAQNQLLQQSE